MQNNSLQEQNLMEHCFGCGTKNENGLHLESYWQNNESICKWQAKPFHTGGKPGIVYGGLIASLIDCHSVNTAISHSYRIENREPGSTPILVYLTAQLNVSYLEPTPINKQLLLKAKVLSVDGRKTWVECSVNCDDQICAKGRVLAIRI